jgi:hypothetical protein
LLACSDDLLLDGETFCVRDAAEMEEMDEHSNNSAVAITARRESPIL